MSLDAQLLSDLVPRMKDPDKWVDAFNDILPQYGISNKRRVSAWIAQCGHESMDFNVLEENLNYSASALVRVWPRHFPNIGFAQRYHRNPEAIANRAYRNRMGNGPEESGEGWLYRGRGLIMITGKSNYYNCSKDLFDSDILLERPDLLVYPHYATHSACWFWDKHGLNQLADNDEITRMSKVINGGTNGLQDRLNRYRHCLEILDDDFELPEYTEEVYP